MRLPSVVADAPLVALAGALTVLLLLGSAAVLAYWIYRDASVRNASGPVWWTVVAFTGVGLLWYLAVRGERDPREGSSTRADRLVSTWTIAMVLAFAVVAVATPPDPFTQVLALPPAFAAALAAVHLWTTRLRSALSAARS